MSKNGIREYDVNDWLNKTTIVSVITLIVVALIGARSTDYKIVNKKLNNQIQQRVKAANKAFRNGKQRGNKWRKKLRTSMP